MPFIERPEPLASPLFIEKTILGLLNLSLSRLAIIPITPSCHPSPDTISSLFFSFLSSTWAIA